MTGNEPKAEPVVGLPEADGRMPLDELGEASLPTVVPADD
jgi:hypothetical protein